MADYKKRVQDALNRHHDKLHKQNERRSSGVSRKNGKPEQLVVKAILQWAQGRGLDLHVVESKAVYSKAAGRYLHSQISESLSDLIGNYQGFAIYVEVKAKGRASTLKEHQRLFLSRKATQGCFATVADSVEVLALRFEAWLMLSPEKRPGYLLKFLQPKKADDKPLF